MEDEDEPYESILDIWPEYDEWRTSLEEADDERDY